MTINNGLKEAKVEFGEGIKSSGLARLFQSKMELNRAKDGEYEALTGKVYVKEMSNHYRLFVDVHFKDSNGNNILIKYSNELDPYNYYIRKLFSDFQINYQNDELDLSPLSNVYVKIVVKNNGPYCNVVSMIPLAEEESDLDKETEALLTGEGDFPLSNVYVKIVVKNNGPYCNVVSMIPLAEEESDLDKETEALLTGEGDLDLDLDLDEETDAPLTGEGDLDLDLDLDLDEETEASLTGEIDLGLDLDNELMFDKEGGNSQLTGEGDLDLDLDLDLDEETEASLTGEIDLGLDLDNELMFDKEGGNSHGKFCE